MGIFQRADHPHDRAIVEEDAALLARVPHVGSCLEALLQPRKKGRQEGLARLHRPNLEELLHIPIDHSPASLMPSAFRTLFHSLFDLDQIGYISIRRLFKL